MTNPYDETIKALLDEIEMKEKEVATVKQTVNMLSVRAGKEPVFSEADLAADSSPTLSIQSDTFYGQPLNSSVRKILEMRRSAGDGPATAREIYEALSKGNYQFDAKNDQNAIRGLRISLGKSSKTFHKLPDGKYGLMEWYPNAKTLKATKNDDVGGADNELGDDE